MPRRSVKIILLAGPDRLILEANVNKNLEKLCTTLRDEFPSLTQAEIYDLAVSSHYDLDLAIRLAAQAIMAEMTISQYLAALDA